MGPGDRQAAEAIRREHRIRRRRFSLASLVSAAGLAAFAAPSLLRLEQVAGIEALWVQAGGFAVFVLALVWAARAYRCPACEVRLIGSARRVRATGQCPSCGVSLS